jgi:hypothetical protein
MNESEKYAHDAIITWVWSGFCDPDEVQEMVGDILEDGVDEAKLRAFVAPEFARKRSAEKGWPAETDCDRLDAAFADLSDDGIVALHNAGVTIADGINDVAEVLDSLGRDGIHGYCFYHAQDIERAIAGGGLSIAFGDVNEDPRNSAEVARAIQRVLERHGFGVQWDGDVGTRLSIPQFDWKRRLIDIPDE